MSTDNIQSPSAKQPIYVLLWQDALKHRRLYYKVLAITFVVAAIIMLGTPNYYNCTVKLAPELSGSKSSSSLASIASSFGLSLGSAQMGSEALFPTLYPDLMNSVAFRASLFSIKVQPEESDSVMTYYDYLDQGQKTSLLGYVFMPISWTMKTLSSLLKGEEDESDNKIDPFKLTKDQYAVFETIEKKIVCDVDKKTLVITIDVTDQDPLVAANMADSVQMHLQEFITDYRTKKARIDLEYNKKLFAEARDRYEKARKHSAAFNDANQKVFLDRVLSERTDLENEMQLQYRAYSQIAAQLQLAEAKVQEETPAFTLLQPASVPVKKSGPKRSLNCLICLFLAFLATSVYILYKEDHLKLLLSSDDDEDGPNSNLLTDEEYILVPKSSIHRPAPSQ